MENRRLFLQKWNLRHKWSTWTYIQNMEDMNKEMKQWRKATLCTLCIYFYILYILYIYIKCPPRPCNQFAAKPLGLTIKLVRPNFLKKSLSNLKKNKQLRLEMKLAFFLGKEKAEYRFKESDFVAHHHQSFPGGLPRQYWRSRQKRIWRNNMLLEPQRCD